MPNRPYKELSADIERFLATSDWQYKIEKEAWAVPHEILTWINGLGSQDSVPNQDADQTKPEACQSGETQRNEDPDTVKGADEPKGDDRMDAPGYPEQEGEIENSAPVDTRIQTDIRPNTDLVPSEGGINFRGEMRRQFNRPGISEINRTDDAVEILYDPTLRREKEAEMHLLDKATEPGLDERRSVTERTILERPDESVRVSFQEWYGGRCQICGRTFPERSNGHPYFVASYIVPRRLARECDKPANALCLCADHFAKWQLGAVEADDFVAQIEKLRLNSEGGKNDLRVKIKLCGEECGIAFHEKHLLSLQELLKVST